MSEGYMRPLRRQVLVGWLALIAMTLQLAASFGHFHAHELRATERAAIVAPAGHDGTSQLPADDHDDDESHCAICWAMALSRLAIVVSPPSIAPPQLQEIERLDLPQPELIAQGCPASFRASGPPTMSSG